MARVLVVEDDRLVSLLLSDALRQLGHEVRAAFDGEEAIAILRESGPTLGLAIIDLVMPGVDGAQVLAYCRQALPAMPTVMTSGYSQDYVYERLGDVRPDAFLVKPWEPAVLQALVARLLGGDRPQAAG